MIDVVYIVGKGSRWAENELRYSLRSLEMHVRGIRRVVIYGERPSWCVADLVPCDDPYTHNKDANIIRKTMMACADDSLTDQFLFMNDDIYFVQDVVAATFPNYTSGPLISHSMSQSYVRRVENTRSLLRGMGRSAWHYDVHCPIVIDRSICSRVMAEIDYVDLDGPGVVFKSCYGNGAGVVPTPGYADRKIGSLYAEMDYQDLEMLFAGRPVFSTAPTVPRNIRGFLARRYPLPSKWEIDKGDHDENDA